MCIILLFNLGWGRIRQKNTKCAKFHVTASIGVHCKLGIGDSNARIKSPKGDSANTFDC